MKEEMPALGSHDCGTGVPWWWHKASPLRTSYEVMVHKSSFSLTNPPTSIAFLLAKNAEAEYTLARLPSS